jgi:phage tail sheath protein FI
LFLSLVLPEGGYSMPVTPTYPGVYIEEVASGVHTITGVATSITAFLGRARRGPINESTTIHSFSDYERSFGGLWEKSAMSFAVRDFFLNGGNQAIIVRLYHPMYATDAERDESLAAAQTVVDAIAAAARDSETSAEVTRSSVVQAGKDAAANLADPSPVETDAANQIANAALNAPPGTTPSLVVDAACAKKDEIVQDASKADYEKAAATAVYQAARDAGAKSGALPDDVAQAASAKLAEVTSAGEAVKKAVGDVADSAQNEADSAHPTAQSVATAARTTADAILSDPQKTAAGRVAQAAQDTESIGGKPAADVAASARDMADTIAGEVDRQIAAAAAVFKSAKSEAAKDVLAVVGTSRAAIGTAAPRPAALLSCDTLNLKAKNPGAWGNQLRVRVDYDLPSRVPESYEPYGLASTDLFNLTIYDGQTNATEVYRNVTVKPSPRQVDKVLETQSKLVCVRSPMSQTRPQKNSEPKNGENPWGENTSQTNYHIQASDQASDGSALDANDFTSQGEKQGLYALEKADLFNLLCIPPYLSSDDVDPSVISEAAAYCEKRRAMLLVDSPSSWGDKAGAIVGFSDPKRDNVGTRSKNAALFFPRLKQPNPKHDNQIEVFVPCGVIAGVISRTDAARGVWKAPAGLEATLVGVPELSVPLTDSESGDLNQVGINCLRTMPGAGRVVWGARTLQGDDRLASEWKYVPVRRTALFIEESLYRGTQWVVFEPNDEPLWAQIRLNVGAFMQTLFRQKAFQGSSPREAYFVKCDKETTTQDDINRGVVNIHVGFAPLKPAEFVIIQIQQMAGQIQA